MGVSSRHCSSCGKSIDWNVKYCPYCGASKCIEDKVVVNANFKKGFEALGGQLTITSDLMCFKSHKANVQSADVSISLSDIQDVVPYNSLGIVPNGLKIVTDKREYKFVVSDRDVIVQVLRNNRRNGYGK